MCFYRFEWISQVCSLDHGPLVFIYPGVSQMFVPFRPLEMDLQLS